MKRLFRYGILIILMVAMLIPSVNASTVCSSSVDVMVKAFRDGNWIRLVFYGYTTSLQVSKRYTRNIYLEVNEKDLERVGLKYKDQKPIVYPSWYYVIISVPSDHILFLGERNLYLPPGDYRFTVYSYICNVTSKSFVLHVSKNSATVSSP